VAQALELRAPLMPGPATNMVLRRIRREVSFREEDRFLAPDLTVAEGLVRTGELVRAATEAVGGLE
jgi:histidine ammonia-lyase